MADVFAITCKQSTVHSHLNLQVEGQGTAKFKGEGLYKDIWILNYCMYVYYHEKIYIYICKIHNAYSIWFY